MGGALLLLTVQPHDTSSTSVAFQSHAYSASQESQVALLDSYVGSKDFRHIEVSDGGKRHEELQFNSVVAMHPGTYLLNMQQGVSKHLSVGGSGRYSVIRVGAKGDEKLGTNYPEDLIVFPSSAFTTTAIASLI